MQVAYCRWPSGLAADYMSFAFIDPQVCEGVAAIVAKLGYRIGKADDENQRLEDLPTYTKPLHFLNRDNGQVSFRKACGARKTWIMTWK
jgi:hypothetical protein